MFSVGDCQISSTDSTPRRKPNWYYWEYETLVRLEVESKSWDAISKQIIGREKIARKC